MSSIIKYKEAHKAYKNEKNLDRALLLFEQVIQEHPGTEEAQYSSAFIKNIELEKNSPKVEIKRNKIKLSSLFIGGFKSLSRGILSIVAYALLSVLIVGIYFVYQGQGEIYFIALPVVFLIALAVVFYFKLQA